MHFNDAYDNKYTHKHIILLALHALLLLFPRWFGLRHFCTHCWWPLTYRHHILQAFTVALLTLSALIKMYLVTLRLRQDEINLAYNITFVLPPSYFSLLESLLAISCFSVVYFFIILLKYSAWERVMEPCTVYGPSTYTCFSLYLFPGLKQTKLFAFLTQ